MAADSPSKRQTGLATWMLITIPVVVALLVSAAISAGLYFSGYLRGDPPAPAAEASADEAAKQASDEPQKPPIYLPLEPALVVNFDRPGRVGYLRAGLQLMAREQPVIDAAQANMPMIRNSLLMLLSSQSYEELNSRKGKERLREKTLDEVNSVLEQVGAPGHIEAVYFTAFVMQ